jgi:hypothetical protein
MASDASAEGAVGRVLRALAASGVPYMLTGSFASAFHGAPRTTQDIDIVIAPTLGSLGELLQQFPEDAYYLSREAALQAYGSEGLFNVIDLVSGWKIDFIVRKSRPFSLEEFQRRRAVELLGTTLFVASAEDVVIAKLEWANSSESDRQLQDVAGILRSQGDSIDLQYIDRWVLLLGLAGPWTAAKARAVLPRP